MDQRMAVYLGPFASQPFAEGLRALLRSAGVDRIITLEDPESLKTDVGDEPATVVLEGSDPSLCRQYLDIDAVRMVILIDPAATLAVVGVDNPRWEELANVVTSFVDDAETRPGAPGRDRVRIVDTWSLTSDHGADGVDEGSRGDGIAGRGFSGIGRGNSGATGGSGTQGIVPLVRWVELSLAWALSRRGDDGSGGVMGWSVSPREALRQLAVDPSGEISPAAEVSLDARLRNSTEALFGSGRSLPRAFAHIRDAFALSSRELGFLGLVLAPEIDGRFATAIGVLQDDLTRRRPGLTLMAELLTDADATPWELRQDLHRPDSLVAKGLVRLEPDALAVDAALVPSAAVVAHLLAASPDRVAEALGAEWWPPSAVTEPPLSAEEDQLARRFRSAVGDAGVVQLVGGDPSKRWFGRVASGAGHGLVVGNLNAVESGADLCAAAGDWHVLSRLVGGTLLLVGTEGLADAERGPMTRLVRRAAQDGHLVVADGDLSGEQPEAGLLILSAPDTSAARRSAWWSDAARRSGLPLGAGDAERLAATTHLEPGTYTSATSMAVRLADAGVDGTLVELVQRSAREMTRNDLPSGVRCIEPTYGWDDLVVGDENKQLLRSIPQHVLLEGRVMEDWGFASRMAYGRGISALFSGPSGTGKTMAAQIVAKDLGVDLLQVDLSKTVSKYIGETEKNLDRAFDAAERRGSVLLFDEADALFGRRTEIKDAHDRHANVEVAYLLQRLEAFRGLTILTTNLKQNIDNAFARRLRFVVDFAIPTSTERARIWHQSFPDGVLAEDSTDLAPVASRLPIAGGSIQSIALHAAFLAAPDGRQVGTEHLVTAMRRELLKMGLRSAAGVLDDLVPTAAVAHGIGERHQGLAS